MIPCGHDDDVKVLSLLAVLAGKDDLIRLKPERRSAFNHDSVSPSEDQTNRVKDSCLTPMEPSMMAAPAPCSK